MSASKIFVNLPVKDLEKSKEFFTALGFTFNPQFTDANAACLVMSDSIYAMLVVPEFFKTFTKKEIADTKTTEVINAILLDSRAEVDEITARAFDAGGKEHRDMQEVGDWMYGRSIEDLDGHLWEFFYMDESKAPTAPGK